MVLRNDDHDVDDDDDLEMKPLVGGGASDPPVSPRKTPTSSQKWRLTWLLLCGFAAAALMLRKPTASHPNAPPSWKDDDDAPIQPQLTHKSIPELQKRLAHAEQALEQRLRQQYGAYFDDLFYEPRNATDGARIPRGRQLFTSGKLASTVSRSRWQRKLALKVLAASDKHKNTTLVWATGGHSATAGHGNFYNESYTSYLEQALQPLFASAVNVQFVGRNYAMGGTAAAPEIAWCAKEIFGTDLDVLVWDFGMTDGSRALWKQALYHVRGSLVGSHRHHAPPIHLAFHAGSSRAEGGRYNIVQRMEEAGVGALISSEAVMDAALAAIPDSFGLSDAGIAALPEFVQNFRCDTQIENGDPYCKSTKYHLEQCPERKFQTNWHPGWKWHALMGYLSAFFVIDVLKDALAELSERLVTVSALDLYHAWKAEEWSEYEKFTKTKVPTSMEDVLPPDGVDGLEVERLVQGANFCHTAKLPAEIRHLGLLTETTTKLGAFTYDTGLGLKEIPTYVEEHKFDPIHYMQLVYTEDDRQNCPRPTNMDYKDYFYVPANLGWQSLTVPNPSERQAYGPDTALHGYVALCFTLCPWGACPPGVLDRTAFAPQQLRLRVNGVEVTELFSVLECELLRHADGYQFPVGDENVVTLEAQLVLPKESYSNYVRFSSVIVW
jgi:hypothetical protein